MKSWWGIFILFILNPLWTLRVNKQSYKKKLRKENTTFNGGSLGSCIDEERSKLRYVMWIAETSESSSLWTQLALLGIPRSMPAWVSLQHFQKAKNREWSRPFFYFLPTWALSWDGPWCLSGFKFDGEGARGDSLFLSYYHLMWQTFSVTGGIEHLVREKHETKRNLLVLFQTHSPL